MGLIAIIFKFIGLGGIPAKLQEIIVLVLVAFSVAAYLEHRGAEHELASLTKSSTALKAEAKKEIDKLTTKHAAADAANQEKIREANKRVADTTNARDRVVRDFDAYRRTHPDVESPSGKPEAARSRECGTEDCGTIVVRLAERANNLAHSLGEVSDSLQGCQRDRDFLTGLPK